MSFPPTSHQRRVVMPIFRLSARRVAVAVAVLVGSGATFTLAAPESTFAWDAGAYSSSSESALVSLTNRSRTSAGLKALKVDSTLRSIARWRSKDMIERNYFSHDIPGVGKVFDKLDSVGYCYKVAGENIGWNNYPDDVATAQIHGMFMDSPGHRANVLGKTWDVIGVGAYKGASGKKIWTVLFADKCGSTAPAPAAKPKPKPAPKATVRPKPAATPKPAARPRATPLPSEEPSESPASRATSPLPSGDDLGPIEDPSAEPSDAPDPGTPDNPSPTGAVGLRVVDRGAPQGLLDTIVGDVAGYFFGG